MPRVGALGLDSPVGEVGYRQSLRRRTSPVVFELRPGRQSSHRFAGDALLFQEAQQGVRVDVGDRCLLIFPFCEVVHVHQFGGFVAFL